MSATVWLTAGEAAEHARMPNTRRIMQAIRAGELPVYNPFPSNAVQHVRLKLADVDAWMESQPWEPVTA